MIYLLRHCKAGGQDYGAPLTAEGKVSAVKLINELDKLSIDEIYSSPMLRAIQTVKPFADKHRYKVNEMRGLEERILTENPQENWKEILQRSFGSFDEQFDNGETSRAAQERILKVLRGFDKDKNYLVVSHGNILSLLINYYDKTFGFEESIKMKNPDLFQLDIQKGEVTNIIV